MHTEEEKERERQYKYEEEKKVYKNLFLAPHKPSIHFNAFHMTYAILNYHAISLTPNT